MKVLILGCGYIGRPLAKHWLSQGLQVTGWVRSELSKAELSAQGIEAIVGDISLAEDWRKVSANFDLVVHCAASGGGGPEAYQAVYYEGLRLAIAHLPQARRLFISSTSVYGQIDGTEVNEDSPAQPLARTSQILRETEELGRGAGATILRLAGIYGPGRDFLVGRFLRGEAVMEGEENRWMNHIHRDDVISAIEKVASEGEKTEIYNVCDDRPCTYLEFYQWLSSHFQRPMPPHGPLNPERKRGVTNKRVQNTKLRALGWNPIYPSFREGYLSLISPN